ncbi:brachyurin-like [Anopheles darlingi]|uniref:brachyurin-like n=1 Tax=Anopheles darlingi TaxID=43151 RepID=UPI0021005FCD|nr:brachyurin-like [Anopheles darlingi]
MRVVIAFITFGLLAIGASAHRRFPNIDWSQVKPIEEFDHYWQRLPAHLRALRFNQPAKRIIGGSEAYPGQFPYQVALLSSFPQGTGLCGGTVLTNNFILTAAHCVVGSDRELALNGIAILGAHDRTEEEESQQRIEFSQSCISAHSRYNSHTIRNDIATVQLPIPAVFNDRVQPIALPARSDHSDFAGLQGIASGFGRTSDYNTEPSPVLLFTTNPILSNAKCNEFWSTDLVSEQNICLSPAGGTSSCNGDSGGPLAVVLEGHSVQVGITSFVSAQGCASGFPPVWVRVSYYRDWIEEHSDYVFGA